MSIQPKQPTWFDSTADCVYLRDQEVQSAAQEHYATQATLTAKKVTPYAAAVLTQAAKLALFAYFCTASIALNYAIGTLLASSLATKPVEYVAGKTSSFVTKAAVCTKGAWEGCNAEFRPSFPSTMWQAIRT